MAKKIVQLKWKKYVKKPIELFENSTMHGLKHIGRRHRPLMERVLWVFIFGFGVCFSLYLSVGILNKFYYSPTIMNYETADAPVGDYPFPTVTICSQNKISKTKLKHVLRNARYKQITEAQMVLMTGVMMHIPTTRNRTIELVQIRHLLNEIGISLEELINITMQVLVTCEEMLLFCQWKNKIWPCSELFLFIPTDDGYCCSFNSLDSGRNKSLIKKPIETLAQYGYKQGLTVVLDAMLDDYSFSTGVSNGFKVLTHYASEYPDVGERGSLVSPGFEVYIGIDPYSSYNAIEVDNFDFEYRKCYLQSENVLEYYANYSASRCLAECLTRQMLNRCSCRPFHHSGTAKDTDPICHLDSYPCLYQVFDTNNKKSSIDSCPLKCHRACDSTWYNNKISMANFPGELFTSSKMGDYIRIKKGNVSKQQLKEYLKRNVALLNVFFEETTGFVYRDDVRYDQNELLSSIGGLLTLGFGFSVITLMEFIYFAIRQCFKSKAVQPQRQPKHKIFYVQPLQPVNRLSETDEIKSP